MKWEEGAMMAEFEKDINNIIKKINDEIKAFDLELSNIDSIIEQDLELLIEDYKCKIDTTKIDLDSIKMKYKNLLKMKKIEAIQRAKSKLLSIKEDITNSFPDQIDYNFKKEYLEKFNNKTSSPLN